MTPSLASYAFRHRRDVARAAVFVVLTVGLTLAAQVILRNAVNAVAAGPVAPGVLAQYAIWLLIVAGAAAVLAYGMRAVPLRIGHHVEYAIRRDLHAHLARLETAYYRSVRTGDLMTRLGSDVAMVRDLIGQGLLQGLRAVMVCLGALAVMLAVNVRLTAVMLLLFPPMVLIFTRFLRAIRRRHEAVQEQYAEVSNHAQETFAGIRTVKGFALEPFRAAGFNALSHELVRRNLSLGYVQQPLWPLFALVFSVGTVALLVAGGRQIARGEMTLGDLVLFQQLLLYMQWPVLSLGWTAALIQRGLASWRRVQEVFAREPAIADGPRTDGALQAAGGDVEFREVTIRAPDGRILLDRVNLRIPCGAVAGITGPTGSGKSLLVSLLPRLLDPDEGTVLLGGRDLRAYPLAVLRGHIGMAPQEPVLFSETLAHNLGFGLPEPVAGDTLLWAAELAHLDEEAAAFPRKYETLLGERGVTLSGGQRTRTALARAVVRRPGLLILDDVLAAVDTHTEAAILAKLRPVMARCTTLIVSHRISTLGSADFVVAIEDGRVTQVGRPRALEAQPGYYRDMSRMQAVEQGLEAGT